MRSLEQIHLDELRSARGFALNLDLGYARRLAQVAANLYGRTFGVYENEDLRYTVMSTHTEDQRLYEVFAQDPAVDPTALRLGYGSMKTPSESAVEWNPNADIPEGNRPRISGFAEHADPDAGTPCDLIDGADVYVDDPPEIRVGDRINYLAEGTGGMWNGSLVTGVVEREPFKGQFYVTAPSGELGIIGRGQAELAVTELPLEALGERLVRRSGTERRGGQDRRLASRSTEYVLVGTYEIVVGQGALYPGENTVRYKRLNYTSVAADTVRTDELANQLTDALNTVAFMEHGLDPAGVLSIVNADKWEEENEEVLV